MQVIDALAPVLSTVDHGSESVFETQVEGDFSSHQHQVPDQGFVLVLQVSQRNDRLPRDHQHVDRSLWGDVAKRQAPVIFMNDVGRYLSVDDLLENCHCE